MSLVVDNPIINSPFEEPTRYWTYEGGQPVLKAGRRATTSNPAPGARRCPCLRGNN